MSNIRQSATTLKLPGGFNDMTGCCKYTHTAFITLSRGKSKYNIHLILSSELVFNNYLLYVPNSWLCSSVRYYIFFYPHYMYNCNVAMVRERLWSWYEHTVYYRSMMTLLYLSKSYYIIYRCSISNTLANSTSCSYTANLNISIRVVPHRGNQA